MDDGAEGAHGATRRLDMRGGDARGTSGRSVSRSHLAQAQMCHCQSAALISAAPDHVCAAAAGAWRARRQNRAKTPAPLNFNLESLARRASPLDNTTSTTRNPTPPSPSVLSTVPPRSLSTSQRPLRSFRARFASPKPAPVAGPSRSPPCGQRVQRSGFHLRRPPCFSSSVAPAHSEDTSARPREVERGGSPRQLPDLRREVTANLTQRSHLNRAHRRNPLPVRGPPRPNNVSMANLHFAASSAPLKSIQEIQFGLLDPAEIQEMSVAHIIYPETMVCTRNEIPQVGVVLTSFGRTRPSSVPAKVV